MSFSQVKNVRIRSLTPGAVVQLRLGKAASRSNDDTLVEAKVLRHSDVGDKSLVVFEEKDADGNAAELTISKFPGANWRSGTLYVALNGVDESTFTIQKAATPIETDVIGEAIALIEKEHEDVFAPDQLVALLTEIKSGTRIPLKIKSQAVRLAHALVTELSALEPKQAAAVEE